MPRSLAQIIASASDLADWFENHEPNREHIHDAGTLRDVARASAVRATADEAVADAVIVARVEGHTWAAIGAMLGTSGEAARQRYANVTTTAKSVRRPRVTNKGASGSIAGTVGSVVRSGTARTRKTSVRHSSGGITLSERTGKKAASNAGRTVGAKKGARAAKSAAGSALSQRKSSGTTGKKAGANAGKTLGAKKSTKAAKSAAGSALTQRPAKRSSMRKK